VTIPEKMEWWTEARFGMFIHWGIYSLLEQGEWIMLRSRIPKAEYAKLADRFDPERFDAGTWVEQARDAGMRYMVLTTRHHDGFSLWDSQVSDFTSVKTKANRDFIAEYADACHDAGMPVGFYYSVLDWRWPAYWNGPERDPEGFRELRDYVHAQIRELMTDYGKVDILWYDGSGPHTAEDWQSRKLNRMVRRLQPGIIINNRSGLPEDFGTPEQQIRGQEGPWEACMTINERAWGYHAGDHNLKSPMQLVHNLVKCTSGGGNYLLNVGPKADGTIPPAQASRIAAVGKWLRANGESIYGAGAAPCTQGHIGHATAKGKNVYVHLMYWPGEEAVVAGIGNRVLKASILATGEELPFRQDEDRIFVSGLPAEAPDPLDTVVKIEFDAEPKAMEASFWR
jgi:alpha-L-fucosidase